jgi:hypothetical protein
MSLLCRIGLHRWRPSYLGFNVMQVRCERCGREGYVG